MECSDAWCLQGIITVCEKRPNLNQYTFSELALSQCNICTQLMQIIIYALLTFICNTTSIFNCDISLEYCPIYCLVLQTLNEQEKKVKQLKCYPLITLCD